MHSKKHVNNHNLNQSNHFPVVLFSSFEDTSEITESFIVQGMDVVFLEYDSDKEINGFSITYYSTTGKQTKSIECDDINFFHDYYYLEMCWSHIKRSNEETIKWFDSCSYLKGYENLLIFKHFSITSTALFFIAGEDVVFFRPQSIVQRAMH
ncbi:hypothetical protein [Pseudoalteromonas gelatinilytica]